MAFKQIAKRENACNLLADNLFYSFSFDKKDDYPFNQFSRRENCNRYDDFNSLFGNLTR